MFRIPFAVSMLGFALFASGCEKKEGENCTTLCTDVFDDCAANCDSDDEDCTLTCDSDNEVCLGACGDEE